MRWRSGQSGNVLGFSKQHASEARRFARMIHDATDGGQKCVERLCELAFPPERMRTNSPAESKASLLAINVLLDRLLGRPQQDVNLALEIEAGTIVKFEPLDAGTLSALACFDFGDAPQLEPGDVIDADTDDASGEHDAPGDGAE